MKKCLLACCAGLLFLTCAAQNKIRLNLGFDLAQPLPGGLKTGFSFYDQFIVNPARVAQPMVLLQFASFGTESNPVVKSKNLLALRGGYRLAPSKTRLFFDGEAGAGLVFTTVKGERGSSPPSSQKDFGFAYAAGTGVFIQPGQRMALSLKYNAVTGKAGFDWVSLGIALTLSHN